MICVYVSPMFQTYFTGYQLYNKKKKTKIDLLSRIHISCYVFKYQIDKLIGVYDRY